MKNIKTLILTTTLACAPALTLYAMDIDEQSEEERKDQKADNKAHATAIAVTPESTTKAVKKARIQQFFAKKANHHILPFLPINTIVDIVFDYTKPTDDEIERANLWLHIAINNNDVKKAQAALENGANSDDPNALIRASTNNCREIVDLLLSEPYHANAQEINAAGDTALHKTKDPYIIKILLAHNANVNIKNSYNTTPLWQIFYYLTCGKQSNTQSQPYLIAIKMLIFADADPSQIYQELNHSLNQQKQIPLIKQFAAEAFEAKKQTSQQLHKLKSGMRTKMLQNLHMSIDDLISMFNDAIPYYTNQGEYQPVYDLLNEHITQQLTHIAEELEIERLLNQPDCLATKNIANITLGYLFAPEQQSAQK